MLKKTRKTNCFTPTELKKLPTEYQFLGEGLESAFGASELIAIPILQHLGLFQSGNYSHFLKKELNQLLNAAELGLEEIASSLELPHSSKAYWNHGAKGMALGAIATGQENLEKAFSCLLEGDVAGYSDQLFFAGAEVGRLALIHQMCEENVYRHLYLIGDGRQRAAGAGIKSGAIRRKQSRVPTPANLKIARQKLLDAGKPPREISAMLAKKYDCTTDHIRKVLKRD